MAGRRADGHGSDRTNLSYERRYFLQIATAQTSTKPSERNRALPSAVRMDAVTPEPTRSRQVVSDDQAGADRRRARREWPMRRYDLGQEPSSDSRAHATAGERLAMVWPLTLLSWKLAGRKIPDYERADTPGTLLRSGAS